VTDVTGPQIDLPALFHAADQSSLVAQRRFLRLTQWQLGLLVSAAATTLVTWKSGQISYGALVGAVALVFAGVLRVQLQVTDPSRTWYQGRAAAESAKTLAWRYAVGGDPFPISIPESDADQMLIERLNEVVRELEGLEIVEVGDADEITGWMRETRQLSLDERIGAYDEGRIRENRAWYSAKAQWNRRRGQRWGVAMLLFEAFGIIQALFKATGVVDIDVLGLIATILAGIAAWIQTKDYGRLASAYAVAARELSSINALLRHQTTEDGWARFMASAEDSISREHTLWRASRT
jgi:hypothetical protein